MSIWLRIAGYPATEIAAHSPVTWETGADGGSIKASWEMALSLHSQHQALRPRALVQIMCGPGPIWTGELAYAERDGWALTAYGLASVGRKYLALDGGGATTRDVGVAIQEAADRGWRVNNPAGVGGVASGDSTGNPITFGQLADERAVEVGQRWGVDGTGRLFMRADPTAPTWLASPGASAFGSTSEDQASRLAVRYLDSTTSTYQTVYVGAGIPEASEDLSDRGAMTAAEATGVGNGMLARGRGGSAWTNGVNLTRDQLTTMGGTPAFLPAVRGGQLMRSFGLAYAVSALRLDTVIGLTRYTQGSRSIYVEPVNTSPSTVAGVIAA